MINNQQSGKKKQNGLALLVLVIIIFLAISSYYFSTISLVAVQVDKVETTQVVLKRAKKALLDYAIVNWHLSGEAGKIGKLPCPDYKISGLPGEMEGEPDSNCGNAYANGIGYFPWRKLGLESSKDSSGSCLLYAVSPAFKSSPAAALNPDSYGQFRVVDRSGTIIQGEMPEDRPVVVIIAPEATLSGQVRENNPPTICGSYYGGVVADLVAAYLDNDGATDNAAIDTGINNVIDNFVSAYAGSDEGNNPLNDRLITISHREFWNAIENTITSPVFDARMENLTEAIARCFAAYGDNNGDHLPMPAANDLKDGEYRRSSDYDDGDNFATDFSGRLPYNVMNSNTELGNGHANNIFSNAYCDGLELTTTAAADNIRFTDDAGGDQGEFFDLWTNWKDHFFYAVSKTHKPDATVAPCPTDCISVNGVDYAGIVFFSGLKMTDAGYDQQRFSSPFDGAFANDADDDKDEVINYLENNNGGKFPDSDGDADYNVVAGASNDIMFCIKQDMTVVSC